MFQVKLQRLLSYLKSKDLKSQISRDVSSLDDAPAGQLVFLATIRFNTSTVASDKFNSPCVV